MLLSALVHSFSRWLHLQERLPAALSLPARRRLHQGKRGRRYPRAEDHEQHLWHS